MNRIELLLSTPAVTLCGFDHPPDTAHRDPEREIAPGHTISFVDEGSFDVEVGEQRWAFGPGSLFVTDAGMEFSCRHDCETPTDRCLSIGYAEQTVEDLLLADVIAPRPPYADLSSRGRYLRHRLSSCTPADAVRFELLAGALFESLADVPGKLPDRAPPKVTRLMRRVDRAAELIEAEYARELRLADLAEAAGLSPFHFARAFRALTGLPPHRYLLAVRLRQAALLLRGGAGVTFACYEVGFGSLPDFITVFRKRYGVVPSAVRKGAGVPALRAALTAPIWKHRN
jgi:AraC-like DNA-binding protein